MEDYGSQIYSWLVSLTMVASIQHVLDTALLRTASNAQRQHELLQQGGYGGAAATSNAPARRLAMDISDTADNSSMGIGKWATMGTRASYKALVAAIEPLLKIPVSADDNIKLAQLLATDVEPAGHFFLLGGKMGGHEPWKHCAGAAAVLQEAFERVMRSCPSWSQTLERPTWYPASSWQMALARSCSLEPSP